MYDSIDNKLMLFKRFTLYGDTGRRLMTEKAIKHTYPHPGFEEEILSKVQVEEC
jgi:hypothetical protein